MQQKCKERAAGGPKGKYQQQQQLAGATTTSIAIYCLMHLRKFMQIPKNTYFTLGAGTLGRENSARETQPVKTQAVKTQGRDASARTNGIIA